MEVYCLTEVKRPIIRRILQIFCIIMAVLSLLISGSIIGLVLLVVFVAASAYLFMTAGLEYDCSYFDGDIRFAKVYNKSRRKSLKHYNVSDMVILAPAGDRSLYKYEHDRSVKVYDYTSHKKNVPYYEMVIGTGSSTLLYKLELDDKYLDAVSMKNPMKVVRAGK